MTTRISLSNTLPADITQIKHPGKRYDGDRDLDPSRAPDDGDGWKDGFRMTRANQIIAGSNTNYYITNNDIHYVETGPSITTSLTADTINSSKANNQYLYQPFQQPTSGLSYTQTGTNWPSERDLWITGFDGMLAGFEDNTWVRNETNLDCRFDNQWHFIWRDKNVKNKKSLDLDSSCFVNRDSSYSMGAVPRLRNEHKFHDHEESSPIQYIIKPILNPSKNNEKERYRLYAKPKNGSWYSKIEQLKDVPLVELISKDNPITISLGIKDGVSASNPDTGWSDIKTYDIFKSTYIKDVPKECDEFMEDVKSEKIAVKIPVLNIPLLNPPSYKIPSEIDTVLPYQHKPNYYAKLKNKLEASILEPMLKIVNTTKNVVDYHSNGDADLSTFVEKGGVVSGLPIPSVDDIKSARLNFINNFNELVHSLYQKGVKASIPAFRRLFGTVVNGKLTKLNSTLCGSFAIPSFINAIHEQGKSSDNALSNSGHIIKDIPFVGASQSCREKGKLEISSNITFARVLKPSTFTYPRNAYGGNLPTTTDYYSDTVGDKSLLSPGQNGANCLEDLLPEHDITVVRKEEQMASRIALTEDNDDHNAISVNIPFIYNLYLTNPEDCTIYRDSFLSGVAIKEHINPCCCNLGSPQIGECGMQGTDIVNAAMVSYPYVYFKLNVMNIYNKLIKVLQEDSNFISTASGTHDIVKGKEISLEFYKQKDEDGIHKLYNPQPLIEYNTETIGQVKVTADASNMRLIRNDDFTTKSMAVNRVMQDLVYQQNCYSIGFRYE